MDEARGGGYYDLRTISIICAVILVITLIMAFSLVGFMKDMSSKSTISKQNCLDMPNDSIFVPTEITYRNISKTNYFYKFINESYDFIFKITAWESDYSNSTIKINMSRIEEIRESNGSLIIEIRKEGTQSHGLNIEYNNNITELIK